MTSVHNHVLFVVFILLQKYFLFYSVTAKNYLPTKAEHGPYKNTIINGSRCDKPTYVYQKSPSVVFNTEVYTGRNKNNLLKGNATIVTGNTNYKIIAKYSVYDNGKWMLYNRIVSDGCRGKLIKIILKLLNTKHNNKQCSISKGTYKFENMDINVLHHAWESSLPYGPMKWSVELLTKTETVECWEFHSLITPLGQ